MLAGSGYRWAPSGLIAAATYESGSTITGDPIGLRVATSHSSTVPSALDVASVWPSGVKRGQGNATATMASILRSVASGQGGDLADHARMLARAYTNAADALIVTWRDKARYSFWRPITAIREAASDGNAATAPEATWTSLITAPPYPDHPSGVSAFGCSVVDTLQHFYGHDAATFSGMSPASTRTFTSFSQLCDDIVDARVWSGIPFRFADEEAAKIGRRVAHWGNRHAFR